MKNYFNKIFRVLDLNEKIRLFFFSILSFINACLEFLSIGLLIPLIASVIGKSEKVYFLDFKSLEILDTYSLEMKLVYVLVIISIIYLFKNIFIVIIAWFSQWIINQIRIRLSNTIFNGYINETLSENLEIHTSSKVRNLQIEVYSFSKNLRELLQLLTEILVVLFLGSFLIFLEPLAAILAITSLGLLGGLFYLLTRKKISFWGNKAFKLKGITLKIFIESLNLFKEIRINEKNEYFSKKFKSSQEKLGKFEILSNFFQIIPRYYIEVVSILSLALFTFILVNMNLNAADILPILIAYIAAGLRLMPSINRIINSLQLFRFHLPAIDMIFKETGRFKNVKTKNFYKNDSNEIVDNISFQIKDVSFKYPNTEKFVLDNVNLKFEQGEYISLKGKTGSGKSTLLNLVLGFYNPTFGKITFNGKDIKENIKLWYSNIAYVPQDINLLDGTLVNNICLGLEDNEIDYDKLNHVIKICKLGEFISSLSEGFNTHVGELGKKISGGQKQRVGIARALYSSPKILILDEAMNALDEKTESEIYENLREIQRNLNISILSISHNSSADKFSDKIYDIDNKKLKLIYEK